MQVCLSRDIGYFLPEEESLKTPLLCLLALFCSFGNAQEYSIQKIPLGPSWIGTFDLPYHRGIQAINRRGELLAMLHKEETDYFGSFIFLRSGWEEVTMPGRPVFSLAMNRHATVVGGTASAQNPNVARPFIWSNGRGREIQFNDSPAAWATSINDHGHVVGFFVNAAQSEQRAFLFRNNKLYDLGPGHGGTLPLINNAGDIALGVARSNVGAVVLLRDGRTNFVGGLQAFQFGMNNRGDIVGYALFRGAATHHAFVYRDGETLDLQAAEEPFGIALAINDAREIVGYYQTTLSDGTPYDQGFFYSRGQRRKLSQLVQDNGSWDFGVPSAINDEGQIAGMGLHEGQVAAYLLTPLKRRR